MNDFLKEAMNQSTTWNGAISYLTTGSNCVDQFGKAGSYRGRDISIVFDEQKLLWDENKEFAIKFPFYLRMITRKTKKGDGSLTNNVQKGQGARDESFKRLLWFAHNEPNLFYDNLWILPIIGSWKDLWVLLTMDNSLNKEKIFAIIAEGCKNDVQKDLVKKYLPQIRANKKCTTEWTKKTNALAKQFCKWVGWSQKDYRLFKSTGKAHEFQKFISRNQYDKLIWNNIPSKALLNLSSGSFLLNHGLLDNYIEWIKTMPVAKFNGYPYELGYKLRGHGDNKALNLTIDAQFNNLINTYKNDNNGINGNVWCAIDTSGSMFDRISNKSELTAFDVCISLGIYFSSLNLGTFHKNVIMFDDYSKILQLTGTFSEMYKQIITSNTAWGSTNFMSVIDEIVRIRKYRPNIPIEDYPTTLLIISDMQFNPTNGNINTNYEEMKEKLLSIFPTDFVNSMKFIWWQVNGRNVNDMPATLNDGGCYFFSGFDGTIISLLLGNNNDKDYKKPTMEEIILSSINQEIFNLIKY